MKISKLILLLSAAAVLAVGCKNDKESDIVPPADADYTDLVLNEICGGTAADSEDDWVEVYNKGTEAVPLSGVRIVKTDEEGKSETIYTFSESDLAGGAYRVVKYKSGELSAKISNSKQVAVTLASPSGTTIDRFDRDAAVGTGNGHGGNGSYARIPDGTGKWSVVSASTEGKANAADGTPEPGPTPDPEAVKDYSGLVLNELNGNKPVKYIEICNRLDKPVDLEGVQLCKNDETPAIWIAPAGMTIAAGGRVTLVSDQETNDSAAGFKGGLSAKKSVKIELVDPEGNSLDVFKNLNASGQEVWDDTPKYNGEAAGESYGRYPDATGEWYMMSPTQGEGNSEGTNAISMEPEAGPEPEPEPEPSASYEGLVLNELNGNDPKYIELYNGSAEAMDITGVKLRKDGEDFVYTAPEGTVMAAGGFLQLLADQTDPSLGFSSGLSAKKSVMIELLAPDGTTLIDIFKNPSESKGDAWGEKDPLYNGEADNQSYGRYPDGTGSWYMMSPTQSGANAEGAAEDMIVW